MYTVALYIMLMSPMTKPIYIPHTLGLSSEYQSSKCIMSIMSTTCGKQAVQAQRYMSGILWQVIAIDD